MPLYIFRCKNEECDHTFKHFCSMRVFKEVDTPCEECGKEARYDAKASLQGRDVAIHKDLLSHMDEKGITNQGWFDQNAIINKSQRSQGGRFFMNSSPQSGAGRALWGHRDDRK